MPIHPTAIIDSSAKLDEGVTVGPYCVIGADVVVGKDTTIGSHTVIDGPTTIGAGNKIGHHCSLGGAPQDLSYKGEPTKLVIGNENFLGDYVQVSRGSTKTEHQTTTIGNKNFLMAYCHVGHDCIVGDNVIAANALQLAGHVTVEDRVVFGGLVAIHQFVRVGKLAMISGGSVTAMDIPPFTKVFGYGCPVHGLNAIGLERAGVERAAIKRLREAYKLLFRSGTTLEKALATLETEFADSAEAQHWVHFFRTSKRGIVRERASH
ncbi:MAG: acyl-ACP--UDP-N-acetylglucosamine O-acyltransferase [Planctomycetes bacterium]|nr:acyl-ACP--UDP-N-acetylglucosamine O-acyltransferase [Planctomycetota bacterium]MCA8935269.1 acyl-ACP--UDP-N-acetylglucosamine O-acyltransferase [Planctomycetota bacterium]